SPGSRSSSSRSPTRGGRAPRSGATRTARRHRSSWGWAPSRSSSYVVKSLPLDAIRWLVVVVVLYAGLSLLRTAMASRPLQPLELVEAPRGVR
ncbi:MAG: hypothetical protein AB7H81_13490, partial [Vicinamibacterales bacterium]